MAINISQYPTGYVDPHCYERKAAEFFIYHSPIQHRDYELQYVKLDAAYQWNCNCPDARYVSHKIGKPCKHEKALTQMQRHHEEHKAEAEFAADMAAEQSEITALRAEVEQLRAELAEQKKQSQEAPAWLREMQAQVEMLRADIVSLRSENEHIKEQLKTKATARKKHQSETESAQIKEQINTALDDAMQMAENAIHAAQMARAGLADLEAIPYTIKQELDALAEAGKEELQPDYKTPDHNAPEIKALVRSVQEDERTRHEATSEERRKIAPLNGNSGFSLLKKR